MVDHFSPTLLFVSKKKNGNIQYSLTFTSTSQDVDDPPFYFLLDHENLNNFLDLCKNNDFLKNTISIANIVMKCNAESMKQDLSTNNVVTIEVERIDKNKMFQLNVHDPVKSEKLDIYILLHEVEFMKLLKWLNELITTDLDRVRVEGVYVAY